ncbi:MAG: type II toxin-antitoxin system RelE/ParE family toxin [Sciscionella sp.]|nr:type II toxin-antitoxin system RelE/ParE family toxin [Sciscionella sp.]
MVWSRPAKRAIEKELPESVAAAALELILGPLRDNPRRIGKPLRPPLDGVYSARRATYRVLYRIDDDTRTITIEAIRHRSSAYR